KITRHGDSLPRGGPFALVDPYAPEVVVADRLAHRRDRSPGRLYEKEVRILLNVPVREHDLDRVAHGPGALRGGPGLSDNANPGRHQRRGRLSSLRGLSARPYAVAECSAPCILRLRQIDPATSTMMMPRI